jgi:hypothetical protein
MGVPSGPFPFRENAMVSKSMILGAAAALVATATGYFIATGSSGSHCNGGCPISAMFGSENKLSAKDEESGECGSCCGKASKAALLAKKPEADTPTLAACVGASAYALQPPAACCDHE